MNKKKKVSELTIDELRQIIREVIIETQLFKNHQNIPNINPIYVAPRHDPDWLNSPICENGVILKSTGDIING